MIRTKTLKYKTSASTNECIFNVWYVFYNILHTEIMQIFTFHFEQFNVMPPEGAVHTYKS